MKSLSKSTWEFRIDLDNRYGFYWWCEDSIKESGIEGFLCSKKHYKTANGCLKNLNRFASINGIKNWSVKGEIFHSQKIKD